MQMTRMGQTSVKEISPHDLAQGSQPWPRRYDFYSARMGLLLCTFPRVAKRFVRVAKRALMLIVIGITMVASGRAVLAGPLAQETAQESQAGQETPEELQQLVAPIALYPDELIAQILAASTYPTQIVQADRWLQQHSNLHLSPDQSRQELVLDVSARGCLFQPTAGCARRCPGYARARAECRESAKHAAGDCDYSGSDDHHRTC